MKRVVVFGAGASYASYPVVEDIVKHIPLLLVKLEKCQVREKDERQLKFFIDVLQRFQVKLSVALTPDAVLRNTYITDRNLFYEFYKGFWIYLLILQYGQRDEIGLVFQDQAGRKKYNKFVDPRYGEFIGNYLKDESVDFTILSWNYDLQFQMAYKILSNASSLHIAMREIRTHPFELSMSKLSDKKDLIHLNGFLGFYDYKSGVHERQQDVLFDLTRQSLSDLLEDTLWVFDRIRSRGVSFDKYFRFSFMNDVENYNYLSALLQNNVAQAESVSFIGYSFPKQNEQLDQVILNISRDARIILQNPVDYSQKLVDRFGVDRKRIAVETNDMTNFIVE